MGTSCWRRSGPPPRDDEDFFVTGFECLGACDIAPMASIDERYFGPLEAAEAETAIEQLRAGAEVLPEKALEKRPLRGRARCLRPGCCLKNAEDPALRTLAGYKGYGGYATLEKAYRELEADEVLKELEDSGLRGRGGAGFSMGKKASFLPRGDDATSTSAATPTSPSRAPSRTAS